jgi:hypothetical protein
LFVVVHGCDKKQRFSTEVAEKFLPPLEFMS